MRDRRAEPRRREAYLKQYVDRPSGEPAFLDAGPDRVQAYRRPLLPLQADRRVEGDAVKPGKKLGVPLEGVERLVRIQERVLNNVGGVFRVIDESDGGVVKPALVTRYQFAEGLTMAAETFRDQSAIVVAHDLLPPWTWNGRAEFPEPLWWDHRELTPSL